MKRMMFVAVAWVLFCTPSHACYHDAYGGKGLYQMFNRFFYAKHDENAFRSDIELLNSSYFMNDEDGWWGRDKDRFSVEMTYAGSRRQQVLGIIDADGYHEVLDLGRPQGDRLRRHEDTSFVVAGDDGFMWTDSIVTGRGKRKNFSDRNYNYNEADLFLAFSITDNPLLQYYQDVYGTNGDSPMDALWLIAFDGADRRRGDFTDLVAVVSHSPFEGDDPIATPVPASVLLLASGCAGLFFRRRRWSVQQTSVKRCTP